MIRHAVASFAASFIFLTITAIRVAALPAAIDTVTVNAGEDVLLAHSHPVADTGRLLLVAVQFAGSEDSVQLVTYAGIPLTAAASIAHPDVPLRTELWQMFNPPVGTADVQVSMAAGHAAKAAVAAVCISGVDPGDPIDSIVTKASTSASGSTVITSSQGDLVLSTVISEALGAPSPSVGATPLWSTEVNSEQFGAGSSRAGATTVNIGWAFSGVDDWVTLTVNINHKNYSPVLAPIENLILGEGETVELTVTAVDEDGTIPSLKVSGLPQGAKFKDQGDGTGELEFTATQDGAGVYDILVIASDGVLADTQFVTITVTSVNVAPVLEDIGPQFVALGNSLALDFSAADADRDPLVLSADPLPPNAVLTDHGDGTASFVFTPDPTQVGVLTVAFMATDGALADSESVRISVLDTATLAFIRVELEDGSAVGDTAVSTDDSLVLFCRGYLADSTLLGDVAVSWSVIGSDSIAIGPGDSTASVHIDLTRPGSGHVVATYSTDFVDSTGEISCSPGLPELLIISPESYRLDLFDTVQFSATALDADSNVTDAGQLTWRLVGPIGQIEPTGLFISTMPGIGQITVATDRSGAVAATGPVTVQAVFVDPVALGTATVHARQDNVVALAFTLSNYFENTKTVTSLTIRNNSSGSGTEAQISGTIDSVALYLDRDLSYDLSHWDTLIVQAPWTGAATLTTPCSLAIEPGSEQVLLFAVDVGPFPHDGDSLDFCLLPASDVVAAGITVGSRRDTVNSTGVRVIDGMTAGQITLAGAAQDTLSWADGVVRVLTVDVPRNGYLSDTLLAVSLENHGTAVSGDLDSLMLFVDDGDTLWDGGVEDGHYANFVSSGDWWSRSGLHIPLDSQICRFYIVAAVSRFAGRGATLQLGIPEFGLAVASGNDGPLDHAFLPVDTVTLTSERELSVTTVPLPGGLLPWGKLTAPLLSLQLVNHSSDPTGIDSLVITSYATDPTGATQAQLDTQFDSLLLFHDLDGIPATISATDTLLGTARLINGEGILIPDGLVLPGGNGSIRLSVAIMVSDRYARDGNQVGFGLASEGHLYCSPSIAVTGSFPAVNPASFVVNGFPAASVSLLPLDDLEHTGGLENSSLFRFVLPGNGYAGDTLQGLRLMNGGTLQDNEALVALRLWRDVTGNGFSSDDIKLANFARVGSEWVAGNLAVPVAAGGLPVVVTADISPLAFRAGTFSPSIPPAGLTYRSGLSGPDDAAVSSPNPILIMPADRITVISLSQSAAVVGPGEANVSVLAFALYNGYSSQKSLLGLGLQNQTRSVGDAAYVDNELGQIWLYDDSHNSHLIDSSQPMASGFFSNGYLRLDGFERFLPPESLSYFFVTANVAADATDADTLIVAVPSALDFTFAEPLSVNGDLPLMAGRPTIVDGSVAMQYEVLPLASKTVRPGDTALAVMAFRPARNGARADRLNAFSIRISGAGPGDLPSVRLWMDVDGNEQLDTGDSLLGLMAHSVDRWTLSSLDIAMDSLPSALFVQVDVASGTASGQTLEAAIPVNGFDYESGNDGPRDQELPAGASFVVYASQLEVAGLGMRSSYSLGESIPVRFSVRNLFATPLEDVTGEAVLYGDTGAVRFDSATAPTALAAGESAQFTGYYTALQTGQVSWAMRAVVPSLLDSSAYIVTSQVQIQAQPTAGKVNLVNSAPASVTWGQRNVFPLTISVRHPDTGAFTAALQLDGVRLIVRDASGVAQPANKAFSLMALGAGFSNYAILSPVPADTAVHFAFSAPVIIEAGEEIQLALLVDIDSACQASSFALSLDSPDALLIRDDNNGLPIPVETDGTFPMSTAPCRINLPSHYLAVAGAEMEDWPANRGQSDVIAAGLFVRNPSSADGSPVQLTGLTLEFVDTVGNPLTASTAVSEVALRSGGIDWAAATGSSLQASRIPFELSSPIILGPGESRLVEVACILDSAGTAPGFRLMVPDSTCLLVREIGSGATLPAATDTALLSTSSAFPVLGSWIDINAPAAAPLICLDPGLGSPIVAGTKSAILLDIHAIYQECLDCSPVQMDGLRLRMLDSTGIPLDPQSIFDRIGFALADSAIWFQPWVELVNGDVHFRFGDTGLVLRPGDSVHLRLVADIEPQCPYDNLVLTLNSEYDLTVRDVADSTYRPGLAAGAGCPLAFPLFIGPTSIIQPAGRPGVSSESGEIRVAYQGQTDVPLLDLEIDYSQVASQGDLQWDGLNGRMFQRTPAGFAPVDAALFLSSVSLWIDDSLVSSEPVTSGVSLGVSLSQAFTIAAGKQVRLQLRGDISPAAERSNYLFVLEDSMAIALRDPLLGVPIYPLATGSTFPINGIELSISGATLQESFSNYPNPFVSSDGEGTTIAYVLPEAASVDIALFTVTGDLVVELVSGSSRSAGEHQSDRWFGKNGAGREVIPGTYICRITVHYLSGRDETIQRKVAVIR